MTPTPNTAATSDLPVRAPTPAQQQIARMRLFDAYRQAALDAEWDADGRYRVPDDGTRGHGGYRSVLWRCLAFLHGTPEQAAKANRIIVVNYDDRYCQFSPCAALHLLLAHRARLSEEAVGLLLRLLELNLPCMATDDLQIRGGNDNHPFKAMHSLIVGGQLLGDDALVRRGRQRLERARELYARNGFPSEYNSPNYTPVSLGPLASLAEHADDESDRQLALALERFVWRDLALHYDGRLGVPTGPISRATSQDFEARLSTTNMLVMHLFPERFADDFPTLLAQPQPGDIRHFLSSLSHAEYSFIRSHAIYYAQPTYHPTDALADAIFHKPAGTRVRGLQEAAADTVRWDPPSERPPDAPEEWVYGGAPVALETYYGKGFSLGSARGAWQCPAAGHAFYATVATPRPAGASALLSPERAAVYFARLFTDQRFPYGESPGQRDFPDEGLSRVAQHENTALVFYTPRCDRPEFSRLATGLFRPLAFSRPRAVWVGETPLPRLNGLFDRLAPVAIDEGDCYAGVIPLPLGATPLTDRARGEPLIISTRRDCLSILMTAREYWQPTRHSFRQLVEIHGGFAFMIHPASAFADFAAFRRYLAEVRVEDDYYLKLRTTTCRTPELCLSASYSPWTQSGFRYVSVNGQRQDEPRFALDGMADPGGDW